MAHTALLAELPARRQPPLRRFALGIVAASDERAPESSPIASSGELRLLTEEVLPGDATSGCYGPRNA